VRKLKDHAGIAPIFLNLQNYMDENEYSIADHNRFIAGKGLFVLRQDAKAKRKCRSPPEIENTY
jgi:hypothetical protein